MMVRQMKEDAKGKSEEELAECFRIFDRCAGGLGAEKARSCASPASGRLGSPRGGAGAGWGGCLAVARAARPRLP